MAQATTKEKLMSEQAPHINIGRIYLKDASFESPKSPEVFTLEDWTPNIEVSVDIDSAELDTGVFECVLSITASAVMEEETYFLIAVEQAGIFSLSGIDDEHLSHILRVFCPTQLFPFARQAVADLAEKGGFPQLLLQPINFEALLQQQQSEEPVKH